MERYRDGAAGIYLHFTLSPTRAPNDLNVAQSLLPLTYITAINPRTMSAHAAIKAGNLAVISGGASGIGLAAAKYYLSQGMKVAIGDRSESSLQSASKALADQGESYVGLLDVADQTSVSLFRKSVFEKWRGSSVPTFTALSMCK